MTHWRPARSAFRSRPIVGRATLTMVLSRRESPLPRTVVRTTARPRGSLTRNAAGPGIAGPGAAGPGVQGPGAGITRSILLAPAAIQVIALCSIQTAFGAENRVRKRPELSKPA